MDLNIDVRAELEHFSWERATWTHDRLIAVSPFRYERTPSFYVYLTDTADAKAGYWGDPGAKDPEWQRGGPVKLLAYLRGETPEDTLQYLRNKYGGEDAPEGDTLRINPLRLSLEPRRYQPLDMRILDRYKWRHPYLGNRGISEPVQRLMRIGYDRERNAIVIPWFNADGTLGAVKYRRVDTKAFWYERGGRPIREMVYGIDIVYSRRLRRVAVVEAEVDAMTLMTAGMPAIATGGAQFGDVKRDIILRSPIEEVVLFRDNDAAGRAWRNQVYEALRGKVGVSIALVPRFHKDVNEAWVLGSRNIGKIRKITSNFQLLA